MHQKLPRVWSEREALREKGQFWTPAWVAEAMVGYVLAGGASEIFDPAVGEGAFFRAGKAVAARLGRQVALRGCEVDPHALSEARVAGLAPEDLLGVEIRDFVLDPPHGRLKGIVANPPYIRHHRLTDDLKARIRALGARVTGSVLDGRAGLHVYFLLRALDLLAEGARLAFIVPADTCEGVFASALWRWVAANYRIDGVVTFEPEASPFPGVDTNAVVLLIERSAPRPDFPWVRVKEAWTEDLALWAMGSQERSHTALTVECRELREALDTGLTRAPSSLPGAGPRLGDYARVVRGIATGANEFFLMTRDESKRRGIPDEFLAAVLVRTRDVNGDVVGPDDVVRLDQQGRPTQLLSLDGRPIEALPPPVQAYLREGEKMGLAERPLIRQRRPWYKMEVRRVPPFLFTYLGRRNSRFVRNLAGIIPLTCFLCVYPNDERPEAVDALWRVLQHPQTVENLALVGKSYGSGAIKVEPRALEQVRLPEGILAESALASRTLPLG